MTNHELVVSVQAGDREALGKLVQRNRGLVSKITGEIARQLYDSDDLEQVGALAIMHAAKKFDLNRGIKFSTYAAWWIRSYVGAEVIRQRGAGMLRRNRGTDPFWRIMRGEDAATIAVDTGRSVEAINSLRAALSHVSLDAESGSGATAHSAIPSPHDTEAEAEAAIELQRAKARIAKAMRRMTPREREVVAMRHLRREETLETIGARWGVSRERVRQVEAKALAKIRRYAA